MKKKKKKKKNNKKKKKKRAFAITYMIIHPQGFHPQYVMKMKVMII
jgi:hypothetical protein